MPNSRTRKLTVLTSSSNALKWLTLVMVKEILHFPDSIHALSQRQFQSPVSKKRLVWGHIIAQEKSV